MANSRGGSRSRDYSNIPTTDHLASSRAQHRQSRENRLKSVSDDGADAISDWSDSDREYDILSDFESTKSYLDNDPKKNYNNLPFNQENSSPRSISQFLSAVETPMPFATDSSISTQVSFVIEPEKPKTRYIKNQSSGAVHARNKNSPTLLLPARRTQSKQISSSRLVNGSTANSQISDLKSTIQNHTRFGLSRENTSNNSFNDRMRAESSLSNQSSFQTNSENVDRRQTISSNFSQTFMTRTYEIKKIYVDDYGRLTDTLNTRPPQPRSRQKWGTIVHPPFPLGYQQISSEQVTQVVERLTSPVRCRDRHTPLPPATTTKRYLSVGETDALVSHELFRTDYFLFLEKINRLSRVKPVRTSEQYWPVVQRQAASIKTMHNNWKAAGIPV
ncbi:unnamed protein product [Adineta ricciae]|uniref:Uncharacterized protein n=1 Tax=Adineta ricciae TaxID=249248 RepID=A0A813P9P8_ADIRI|nr:unnamed protein product [Adineta ricciae]